MRIKLPSSNKLASLLLRVGLASVLLYAAIASLLSPAEWIGFLPQFLLAHLPGEVLLRIFSAYEAVLAVWLLSGLYRRYAAALAALTFAGILLTSLSLLVITFRDIVMVFGALALLFMDL